MLRIQGPEGAVNGSVLEVEASFDSVWRSIGLRWKM